MFAHVPLAKRVNHWIEFSGVGILLDMASATLSLLTVATYMVGVHHSLSAVAVDWMASHPAACCKNTQLNMLNVGAGGDALHRGRPCVAVSAHRGRCVQRGVCARVVLLALAVTQQAWLHPELSKSRGHPDHPAHLHLTVCLTKGECATEQWAQAVRAICLHAVCVYVIQSLREASVTPSASGAHANCNVPVYAPAFC